MDWSQVDVTIPHGPLRAAPVPGVHMAGFHYRGAGPVDISMVAHPAVTLLFYLGDNEWTAHGDTGASTRSSVALGLLPGSVNLSGEGVGECLQVRLSPVVAAEILDTAALTGTFAALDDVLGTRARRLDSALRSSSSWDERFGLTYDFIGGLLESRRKVDREVAYAWQQTSRRCGRSDVRSLAEETGWSRQRLWSRFRSQLGLSPKQAARLVRFDRAARLLATGTPPAEVAARAGYADQPHLARDVRSLVDTTPRGVATAPWLAIDHAAWPSFMPRGRER
ncbi:AraC-like DNA-binding protein [Nocardioides luteus]|uniref:AraC family transcriptional regulator n=1 Tax=Nocardioides luteus TaxID=1844 RepID=A0ABQ5T0F8_9ACTN|nr:helix-turn-helix domain-containing protein [Nocardioides luteus]MDR7310296.1 AraC-like DNA-binding protein [Nocardioides luteus]GGR53649.1 AraC family transcriptional regulator [Nocardioides luteus]GLJ69925.1 AraC family transcriptional regulator [Nocardioides luteus]